MKQNTAQRGSRHSSWHHTSLTTCHSLRHFSDGTKSILLGLSVTHSTNQKSTFSHFRVQNFWRSADTTSQFNDWCELDELEIRVHTWFVTSRTCTDSVHTTSVKLWACVHLESSTVPLRNQPRTLFWNLFRCVNYFTLTKIWIHWGARICHWFDICTFNNRNVYTI